MEINNFLLVVITSSYQLTNRTFQAISYFINYFKLKDKFDLYTYIFYIYNHKLIKTY